MTDWRCQQCGRPLLAADGAPGQPGVCPACGALVAPPAAGIHAWRPRRLESNHAKAQRGLRRIFEPIPRPATYLAGAVLAGLLLSPFIAYMFHSSYERGPTILSDDSALLTVPPPATQDVPHEAVLVSPLPSGFPLDRLRGLQLNATRDEVQGVINLRLLNMRGMQPEIYEATKAGDIEQLTAHFYSGQLKEFRLVFQEKRAAPADVEAELVELFGEPRERADRPSAPAGGFGLPRPAAAAWDQKLESFPQQRLLRWTDGENQVEATIYSAGENTARPTTLLVVHVTAARWLAAHGRQLGQVSVPPTNSLGDAVTTRPRPARLFP